MEDPALVEQAREEWKERLDGEEYLCPIPDGVPPYIIEE